MRFGVERGPSDLLVGCDSRVDSAPGLMSKMVTRTLIALEVTAVSMSFMFVDMNERS